MPDNKVVCTSVSLAGPWRFWRWSLSAGLGSQPAVQARGNCRRWRIWPISGPHYTSGASFQGTSSRVKSLRCRQGCFFDGGGGGKALSCNFAARNARLSFLSPCGGGSAWSSAPSAFALSGRGWFMSNASTRVGFPVKLLRRARVEISPCGSYPPRMALYMPSMSLRILLPGWTCGRRKAESDRRNVASCPPSAGYRTLPPSWADTSLVTQ